MDALCEAWREAVVFTLLVVTGAAGAFVVMPLLAGCMAASACVGVTVLVAGALGTGQKAYGVDFGSLNLFTALALLFFIGGCAFTPFSLRTHAMFMAVTVPLAYFGMRRSAKIFLFDYSNFGGWFPDDPYDEFAAHARE
jgi:hypothetical protein